MVGISKMMGIKKNDKFDLLKEEDDEEEKGNYKITWCQYILDVIYVLYVFLILVIIPIYLGATHLEIMVFMCLAQIYLFLYYCHDFKMLCGGFIILISILCIGEVVCKYIFNDLCLHKIKCN